MDAVKYDVETGKKLIRDIRDITITYQGHSKTFSMPGWYPEDNDEGTFTQEDMKAYDRAQVQAGTILDGGKKAFQKYESGEILPSRAISNLLKLLSIEPQLLKSL